MPRFPAPPLDAWPREDDGFVPLSKDWIEQPVGAVFDRIAGRQPDRLAISDGVRRWTYGELAARVAGIAALLGRALPHASPVGLAFPSDARMPAAMLAALKAGLAYVPIDLSFPAERNRAILRHSGAAMVLTTAEYRHRVEAMADGLPVLVSEDATPGESWSSRGGPDDVAYVLYTSGSTGRPKGVYQNQRNLLHDVMQYANSIHLTAEDRLTLLYSPSVNGAIRDVYGALLTGAALHVVDLKREGLARIADTLRHERITLYHSMPPVLRAFLGGLPAGAVFDSVRMVYLAGDRLFRSDVALCRRHFPARSRIYTGLGSTENATIFRQWFIEGDTPLDGDLVPVGRPVEDRPSRLLSEDGRAVAPGAIGEIVVSGRHMALGYWNEPELTRSAFRPCPDDPQARRFHTGDLGRETADGLLHFLGRKDRQIKVRGYRVEPAEIEATLRQCPSVGDAAVVADESGDDARLVAFVVACGDAPTPEAWLAGRLPPHLRPERIVRLAAIPTLANFKPDHEALKALARTLQPADPAASPTIRPDDVSPEATALRRIWSQLLSPGSFERDDRFADAGGDSLRGLSLLMALEQALQRPLSPEILSGTARPSALLARLRGTVAPGLARRSLGQPGPVMFLLPGILSADISTIAFAERLRRSMTVAIIDYRDGGDDLQGELTEDRLFAHIRAVVGRHGPPPRLWLLGFSFGAKIAAEAARRLEGDGIAVELLAAIDGGPGDDGPPPPPPMAPPPLAAGLADWVGRKWRHWRRGTLTAAAVQGIGIRVSVALAKAERFAALRLWLDGLARLGARDAHIQARRQALRHIRLRRLGSCVRHRIERTIVLFSTGDPRYGRGRPADLGWSRLCRDVRIVPIGGGHLHALAPENHETLAATLERLIDDPAALAEPNSTTSAVLYPQSKN